MSMEDTIVGNYYISKGSYVVLRRQGLGMNPRIWTEPLEFKQERHLRLMVLTWIWDIQL